MDECKPLVSGGLRACFDRALRPVLLYKQERAQADTFLVAGGGGGARGGGRGLHLSTLELNLSRF